MNRRKITYHDYGNSTVETRQIDVSLTRLSEFSKILPYSTNDLYDAILHQLPNDLDVRLSVGLRNDKVSSVSVNVYNPFDDTITDTVVLHSGNIFNMLRLIIMSTKYGTDQVQLKLFRSDD